MILNTPEMIRSSVCKVEILQVTVIFIKLKFYPLFRLISDDVRLKVPKIAKRGTLVSVMFKRTDQFSINITIQS